ncbi:MAG: hypothetical protein JXR62_00440 [Bacilli bacterium]|nr:hypothetical protein [Bacilli bacterium]
MKRRESLQFFYRFLILTIITIIGVGISVLLTSAGTVGVIIGGLFVVVNVFFLLFALVIAFTNLVKHIVDKKKEYFDVMYIVNIIFVVLVTGVFLTFYFMILAGAMILIAPLL